MVFWNHGMINFALSKPICEVHYTMKHYSYSTTYDSMSTFQSFTLFWFFRHSTFVSSELVPWQTFSFNQGHFISMVMGCLICSVKGAQILLHLMRVLLVGD
jgi:hypothetical protein